MTHVHLHLRLCGPAIPPTEPTLIHPRLTWEETDASGEHVQTIQAFPSISQAEFQCSNGYGGNWPYFGVNPGGSFPVPDSPNYFPCTAGTVVTIEADVGPRTSVGGTISAFLKWHDAAGLHLSSSTNLWSVVVGAGSWARVSGSATPPTGAVKFTIQGSSNSALDNIDIISGAGTPGQDVLNGTNTCAARGDHRHIEIAERAPGAADDGTIGYRVGTLWLNTSNGTLWVMTDASEGAAVWVQTSLGIGHAVDPDAHLLANYNATAAPTVNDDVGVGYGVGSVWIDTTNDNAYIATDVTTGAANWEQANGGGGSHPDLATHDTLGLATDAELAAHAADTGLHSGGGGGGGSTHPLDTPPGTAHAKDDEFASGSLDAKWTAVPSARTLTSTIVDGMAKVEEATTGTGTVAARGFGIVQTAPSGSFTVTAKIHNLWTNLGGSDNSRVGVLVARTADSTAKVFGHQTSVPRLANQIGVTSWSETTDWGTFSGDVFHNVIYQGALAGLWYRIAWDSTASTLTFLYSTNGVNFLFLNQLTGQSQPDRIGIGMYSDAASLRADHAVGCEWFRVTEP